MESLILKKLYLISDKEKSAKIVEFHPQKNLILGENDTGKSCLIKSIYGAFGADAERVNPKWKNANVNSLVEFSIANQTYRLLRIDRHFSLFDEFGDLIWSVNGITKELAPKLAKLFKFNLRLQDQTGELKIPPPAFCLLPFYIDQDSGWTKSWNSFSNLRMFPNYRKNVAYFHTGLLPFEYYEAQAEKNSAEKIKERLNIERGALDKTKDRIDSKRSAIKFDLSPELFADKIERLLQNYNSIKAILDDTQNKIMELYSEKAVLHEQIKLIEAAANELDKDVRYLQSISDFEVVCPTCGTHHLNDFANKFEVISDADQCRRFLIECTTKMRQLEEKIIAEKHKSKNYLAKIEAIDLVLESKEGDLNLGDLIDGESYKKIDESFDLERNQLNQLIVEQNDLAKKASTEMELFKSKIHQQKIKEFYLAKMNKFIIELSVPNLDKKAYNKIESIIEETGSDHPRALLAYYYSIFHTIKEFSTTLLFPAVIDSPVQQEQDKINAKKIIEFATKNIPDGMQLIMGTIGKHGANYDDYIIETKVEDKLLEEEMYVEVSVEFSSLQKKILAS